MERRQRLARQRLALAPALHLQAVGIETVDLPRRGAQEAEARDALTAGHALQEEAVRRHGGEPAVDRERRQAVGKEFPYVRHGPSWPPRAPLKHEMTSNTNTNKSSRFSSYALGVLRRGKTVSPNQFVFDLGRSVTRGQEQHQEVDDLIRGISNLRYQLT